jgi:catechol 2,3-dioxygenase-like lactoylglutathione lyase family enzyme
MRGLLELVLEVNDLEKSLAFYRGALELAEVERWPPPRLASWLSIGRNAVLGLWPRASGGAGVAIAGPGVVRTSISQSTSSQAACPCGKRD